ncbi:Hypothetical_protein [Hexamita inflata]|uniref:Hypothetical_protein n=1 Tax=Hexamita inflata TaxID=28002 RepID=A0ABP1GWR2_9EUKA
MVRRRWIPVQIGLHEAAALRLWMLVPEPLVALAAEVRLTYIGVSKTNDHSRELTAPVQKTSIYIYIYIYGIVLKVETLACESPCFAFESLNEVCLCRLEEVK